MTHEQLFELKKKVFRVNNLTQKKSENHPLNIRNTFNDPEVFVKALKQRLDNVMDYIQEICDHPEVFLVRVKISKNIDDSFLRKDDIITSCKCCGKPILLNGKDWNSEKERLKQIRL